MPVHPLIVELAAHSPILTDGAWGTQLQAAGLPPGACPDTWNLTHPDIVEQVPRSYVAAGSRIVLTNTFRANRLALADLGVDASVADINRAGVEISRRAAADQALVFASLGPSGRLLLAGTVTEDELREAFSEQAAALASAGADALVVETMTDVDEARIAVAAAKATGLPVVACMVFDSGVERDRTMMGVTIEQAVKELSDAGADVLGANCGQGIEGYVRICRRLAQATSRPLWIKANAGTPELRQGHAIYPTHPDDFASYARTLVGGGATFLGGCCGTNPDFIRALARELAS
ncbi:MAG: homocysteine S-methyltransferase family protein [Pirellulales bacterium]